MRKFEFPLQSALELRRREEEAAITRLAEARRMADAIRAELRQSQVRYDELVASLRASDLCLTEVEHGHRRLCGLREAMARQHARLQQADRTCELRRAELLVAAQARETLEQLATRQEAEHRRSESRREQRELDEMAVARHRLLRREAPAIIGGRPGGKVA